MPTLSGMGDGIAITPLPPGARLLNYSLRYEATQLDTTNFSHNGFINLIEPRLQIVANIAVESVEADFPALNTEYRVNGPNFCVEAQVHSWRLSHSDNGVYEIELIMSGRPATSPPREPLSWLYETLGASTPAPPSRERRPGQRWVQTGDSPFIGEWVDVPTDRDLQEASLVAIPSNPDGFIPSPASRGAARLPRPITARVTTSAPEQWVPKSRRSLNIRHAPTNTN